MAPAEGRGSEAWVFEGEDEEEDAPVAANASTRRLREGGGERGSAMQQQPEADLAAQESIWPAEDQAAKEPPQTCGDDAAEEAEDLRLALRMPVRSVIDEALRRWADKRERGDACDDAQCIATTRGVMGDGEGGGGASGSREVEEARRLLGLPELSFVAVQLERASSLGLTGCANELQLQVIKLQADANPGNYSLDRWPTLRSSSTWYSVRNWATVVARVRIGEQQQGSDLQRMTSHQSFPLHATLLERTTDYSWGQPWEPGKAKQYHDDDARTLFECVRGYMGERMHHSPDTLAADFVNTAVGSLHLASEAFAQLVKQLTRNPTPHSSERGWELLLLLLEHALPSASEEVDLLAGFIWLNAPFAARLVLLNALLVQRRAPGRNARLLLPAEVPRRIGQLRDPGERLRPELPLDFTFS